MDEGRLAAYEMLASGKLKMKRIDDGGMGFLGKLIASKICVLVSL